MKKYPGGETNKKKSDQSETDLSTPPKNVSFAYTVEKKAYTVEKKAYTVFLAKNWDFGAGRPKSVWEKKSLTDVMQTWILPLFELVTHYLVFFQWILDFMREKMCLN